METKNYKMNSLAAKELEKRALMAIETITEYKNKKNIQSTNPIEDLLKHTDSTLEVLIQGLSKTAKKKFNKSISKVEWKLSLKSINLFLHYVARKLMNSDYTVKYKETKAQTEILDARKKWKAQQLIAETLLKEYKEKKGTFFKDEKGVF